MDRVKQLLAELERNGRLLPADVVEAARDPDHELHSHFEWTDSVAAEKYRLSQARTLIRTVKIDVVVNSIPLSISSYIRDPEADAKQAGYRNVVNVRTEEDVARSAIVNEMSRVAAAVRRAKNVAAYLGITADIEAIDALARGVIQRVAPAPADAPTPPSA